jgi:hypothetical protein
MSWVGVILSLFGLWRFVSPYERMCNPTRGWGPFRSVWVSICSMHFRYDPTCHMCQSGSWRNLTVGFFDRLLFKVSPKAWKYLHTDVARWLNRNTLRRIDD